MRKKKPAAQSPRVQPMTIAQQWELTERIRRTLVHSAECLPVASEWDTERSNIRFDDGDEHTPNQARADLEHAWRSIAQATAMPPLFRNRGKPLEGEGTVGMPTVATSPLEAMTVFVSGGYYPPPELLLTVMYALEAYFDGKGELSLEECLFGKPKRKAGNHAAVRANSFQEVSWAMEITVGSKKAGGDLKVAESIVERDELEIDPESLLRRARKRWIRTKPE